jgi:hypothetical protein
VIKLFSIETNTSYCDFIRLRLVLSNVIIGLRSCGVVLEISGMILVGFNQSTFFTIMNCENGVWRDLRGPYPAL